MNLKFKKYLISILILIPITAFALEPKDFIQTTVDEASKILSDEITNDQKIDKLKSIAQKTVDVKGIGFYTLGKYRKNLTEEQKEKYSELFEKYFLKSFSSRLLEYTDPQINVDSQEVLNENYTIVNSTLEGTEQRPEIKIDWRVYTKNTTKPLIRDLIIEGLSLARTQKEEFSSIINSNDGNIDALFKTLEEFIKK
jgi:phospholipid transport system substrate-binding protein|tara:strand:- start:69 stop:659 length:591 start_codon:yes stop_codon:yes gene_type:complete